MTLLDRLKTRVLLQSAVDVSDEQGGFVRTWRTIKPLWCEINNSKPSLSFFLQSQERVLSVVVVRFSKDFPEKGRFLHEERAVSYEIFGSQKDKETLRCFCQKIFL